MTRTVRDACLIVVGIVGLILDGRGTVDGLAYGLVLGGAVAVLCFGVYLMTQDLLARG